METSIAAKNLQLYRIQPGRQKNDGALPAERKPKTGVLEKQKNRKQRVPGGQRTPATSGGDWLRSDRVAAICCGRLMDEIGLSASRSSGGESQVNR